MANSATKLCWALWEHMLFGPPKYKLRSRPTSTPTERITACKGDKSSVPEHSVRSQWKDVLKTGEYHTIQRVQVPSYGGIKPQILYRQWLLGPDHDTRYLSTWTLRATDLRNPSPGFNYTYIIERTYISTKDIGTTSRHTYIPQRVQEPIL